MLATSSPYSKLQVQPVPPREPVEVHLCVGHRRRVIQVRRPLEFGEMTLLSDNARSRRDDDLGGRGVRAIGKRIVSRWGKSIKSGCFFDTREIEPNNVSHLLLDIIPLCLRARSAVGEAAFVFRPLEPRFRDLLAQFGIDPVSTYRPIEGERLSFRLSRGLAQHDVGPWIDAPLYSYTGEVYGRPVRDGSGPSKVFLSRRGPRSPTNAAALNAMLEDRGFAVVYLEDLPIPKQIELMQGADQVVAIHGAALAYLALKERTSAVIEILPPNVYHDHFPLGIGHKVARYFQLIPSFDEQVQFSGWSAILEHKQRPFTVDLSQLGYALDEIEAGGRNAGP